MAKDCAPCGRRMIGRATPIDHGRRKEWRVFFVNGKTRDYYTSEDADTAISRHGGGRKQHLSG